MFANNTSRVLDVAGADLESNGNENLDIDLNKHMLSYLHMYVINTDTY